MRFNPVPSWVLLCTTVTAQAGPWQRAVCSHGDASCDAQQWPSRSCRDCRWATPDGCDAGWCALLASCVYHGAASAGLASRLCLPSRRRRPTSLRVPGQLLFRGRVHQQLVGPRAPAAGGGAKSQGPRQGAATSLSSHVSRAEPRSRVSGGAEGCGGPPPVEPSPRRAWG